MEDLFYSCIEGFLNTLPLFRNLFPEKHSHSHEKLYEDIVSKTYVAHNSMEDTIALSAILKKKKKERNDEDGIQSIFSKKVNERVPISYPLLLSTSKVNESNIHILNIRFF